MSCHARCWDELDKNDMIDVLKFCNDHCDSTKQGPIVQKFDRNQNEMIEINKKIKEINNMVLTAPSTHIN